MSRKVNIFFGLIVLLLSSTSISGQLNIKIGYQGGFIESDEIKEITRDFNDANSSFLEKDMGTLNFMSGLNMAFRYRFFNSAIELSWTDLGNDYEALGNINGSPYQKDLDYGIRQYSIGVQNFFGNIGFGASLDSRRLKISTTIDNFDEKRAFLEETQWASTFSLLYQFPSKNVAFTIMPYVQIPWNSYNVAPLSNELFDNNIDQIDTDLMIFGITFAFYNGPQR